MGIDKKKSDVHVLYVRATRGHFVLKEIVKAQIIETILIAPG